MRLATRKYYTLLASLPPVAYFERAERLPINPQRLEERLGMLHPEDAATADQVSDLLAWERQPPERTDAEAVVMYQRFRDRSRSRLLHDMVDFRLTRRTILAALRRKALGLPARDPKEPWGEPEWRARITRDWEAPHFRLEPLFPWVLEATRMIAEGRAIALERLLLAGEWRWLDQRAVDDEFGFDAVLAYLFRWNIAARWLTQDRPGAERRFEKLVVEVIGEHERLFA